MQAHAGHPRRARTCAAALLTCLLTLALAPVSAHASTRSQHPHRPISGSAVVLPSVVAGPAHASDHSALLPGPARVAATLVLWPGTANSSTTARPRTAETPPARSPPAQGLA